VEGKIEEDRECPKGGGKCSILDETVWKKDPPISILSKKCQILSNFVSEDFIGCNIRVDSELCITRAGFRLLKKFDINQRKKVQRHRFGRIKAKREGAWEGNL